MMRERIGLPLSPFDRAHYDYERYLATALSLIGAEEWEAAWAEGRAMTLEQTLEYALGTDEPAAPTPLTRREMEVSALVAQGLTNRVISERLGISRHTVNTHVHRILRKLDLRSRAQLAAWMAGQRNI